jgi:hypothetical protein
MCPSQRATHRETVKNKRNFVFLAHVSRFSRKNKISPVCMSTVREKLCDLNVNIIPSKNKADCLCQSFPSPSTLSLFPYGFANKWSIPAFLTTQPDPRDLCQTRYVRTNTKIHLSPLVHGPCFLLSSKGLSSKTPSQFMEAVCTRFLLCEGRCTTFSTTYRSTYHFHAFEWKDCKDVDFEHTTKEPSRCHIHVHWDSKTSTESHRHLWVVHGDYLWPRPSTLRSVMYNYLLFITKSRSLEQCEWSCW